MTENLQTNFIKKHYDGIVKKESKGDYKQYRWFNTKENLIDYNMTLSSILFHIENIHYKKVFELGPGPGVWTPFLIDNSKDADFLLVDISEEMIRQAKNNLKKYKNIDYKRIDFLELKIVEKFDLFFSSRAIEYIPHKSKVIKKIYDLMKENGTGIIITKLPHPIKIRVREIIGGKINQEHLDRITPKDLKQLLEDSNFKDIEIYPVIIPRIIKSTILRKALFNFFYKKELNIFSNLLIESYLVKFRK